MSGEQDIQVTLRLIAQVLTSIERRLEDLEALLRAVLSDGAELGKRVEDVQTVLDVLDVRSERIAAALGIEPGEAPEDE